MKRLVLLLLLLILPSGSPLEAVRGGATVRGGLYRVGWDGREYPAPGMAVRLNHPRYGPSAVVYTDNSGPRYGMYYFYGIPTDCCFVVEVFIAPGRDWQRSAAFAVREPMTDVPPIRVP